eukprot:33040-Karenia_brevis.AAC.1
MAKNKASDRTGLVVEMLQKGSVELRNLIAEVFTDILRGKSGAPAAWKKSFVSVLYKKGDPKIPDNYRPITLLPILYKLFVRVVHSRIKRKLDEAQVVDQAGFRSGYACDDHLQAVVLLIEKSFEFNVPVWICAIDFCKAFDSVEHMAIWKALVAQGVDRRYVHLLAGLYDGQVGYISTDVLSRPFQIGRGTKQGDPMSPALFNAVLEEVMRPIQNRWRQRGWGIALGTEKRDLLTNLRFADDILLLATSRQQIQSMLTDLITAAQHVGLVIHSGKTKIMTNDSTCQHRSLKAENASVAILTGSDALDYLGRRLSMDELHDTELEARLEKAWRKFFALRSELCGRKYSLHLRLKLFDST